MTGTVGGCAGVRESQMDGDGSEPGTMDINAAILSI